MADSASHSRGLGLFWALYAVLRILGALWIMLYWGTLTVMWGALLSRVADPFTWMSGFHAFLMFVIVMAFVTALFALLAAVTLLSGSGSARLFAVIAAILGLLSGPVGAALGAYTLVVMLRTDSRTV